MARIPKRLYGPAQIATGPATVYTVPSNRRGIIRHIHVQNPSGSPVTFTMSIGTDAAGTRIFDAFTIPAQAAGIFTNILDHYCYYSLEAAQIVQLASGTNNVLVITINGDEEVLL